MYWVVLITFIIGIVGGCTSVGGVLLIPAINALTDFPMRTIMGTVLVSFFVPSIFGSFLHFRLGNFSWHYTIPLCLGGILTCLLGTMIKGYIPLAVLKVALGLIITAAGAVALYPVKKKGFNRLEKSRKENHIILFCLGLLVGFSSGTTGAGGPVLQVPMMLILGYPPVFAIAIGQPFQVMLSLAGGVGNSIAGGLDWWMWLCLTIPLIVGTFIGIRALRVFNPSLLRIGVSCLCMGTGLYMIAKEFLV